MDDDPFALTSLQEKPAADLSISPVHDGVLNENVWGRQSNVSKNDTTRGWGVGPLGYLFLFAVIHGLTYPTTPNDDSEKCFCTQSSGSWFEKLIVFNAWSGVYSIRCTT